MNRPPATHSSRSVLHNLRRVTVIACFAIAFAGPNRASSGDPGPGFVRLKPKDIVIADSNAGLLKFDPVLRELSVLSAGEPLSRPYGIAIDPKGNLLVTDTGTRAVIRVSPATGKKEILAANLPGLPFGIALDAQGDILVANAEAVLRIKSDTGLIGMVYAGDLLKVPLGVALGSDGSIFVADGSGSVLKVNPLSRAQNLIASGKPLVQPVGIALDAEGNILIADSVARRVIRIDAVTCAQTVISEEGSLTTPVCIAIEKTGALLVSDPDAFDLEGGIIRLGPGNAVQTPLMQGTGNFVNPRGIAIVRPGQVNRPR